jgi:hypothetical protein
MSTITTKRGDTLTLDIVVKDADGVVMNLTGTALRFTVKRKVSDADADAIFQKSTSASTITLTDAVHGEARIVIPPAATSGLAAVTHKLVYDLQLTSGTTVHTLDSGNFIVEADVTITAG